jgi:hypothetical protein
MANLVAIEEAQALVAKSGLTPEEITSLILVGISLGLSFLTENLSVRGADRETIANRAAELFDGTAKRLADRRAAIESGADAPAFHRKP